MSDGLLGLAADVGTKTADKIKGRERDYGSTVWARPHHLLDLSYAELEERNLEVKRDRIAGVASDDMKGKFFQYLTNDKGIKAVIVGFSDLEGRLHTLDYDKNHLISSEDNLTFDGSSIRGFTAQSESDLRLKVDWTTFRWLPADLFGAGKVMVFANVCDKDGSFYESDFRSNLAKLCEDLRTQKGITVNVAPEVEGFIFDGVGAEQNFDEKVGFKLATMSGYYSSLPQDLLRLFIDKFAEAKRALAFENEKDHPEVAPAQFELNFKYSVALDTADQIQLYKLVARQVAKTMGLTACFLPKPFQALNGSGMHTNMSFSKDGVNMFYDANGKNLLSGDAWKFITSILYHANELCLLMNSSVNAYRRLDPHFEAPNEIKVSAVDRGSMIRIPLGNAKSARVEVRTVAPDANPYLYMFALIKAGLKGFEASESEIKQMEEAVYTPETVKLPGNIYVALDEFKAGEFVKEVMGADSHEKFYELKNTVAGRSPRDLGTSVKSAEILYHHEVSNQLIWNSF